MSGINRNLLGVDAEKVSNILGVGLKLPPPVNQENKIENIADCVSFWEDLKESKTTHKKSVKKLKEVLAKLWAPWKEKDYD